MFGQLPSYSQVLFRRWLMQKVHQPLQRRPTSHTVSVSRQRGVLLRLWVRAGRKPSGNPWLPWLCRWKILHKPIINSWESHLKMLDFPLPWTRRTQRWDCTWWPLRGLPLCTEEPSEFGAGDVIHIADQRKVSPSVLRSMSVLSWRAMRKMVPSLQCSKRSLQIWAQLLSLNSQISQSVIIHVQSSSNIILLELVLWPPLTTSPGEAYVPLLCVPMATVYGDWLCFSWCWVSLKHVSWCLALGLMVF